MDDVVACEAGTGDESEVFGLETGGCEEGGDLLGDFVEAGLRPGDCVEFVDGDDDALDAHAADEEGVFFGLAFEAGFEVASAGVDDEDGEIGLTCAGNHVGYEVSVARSVEDGEAGGVGFELVHGDVDGYTSVSLFCTLIEHPCKSEGSFAKSFSFFAISIQCPLINYLEIV